MPEYPNLTPDKALIFRITHRANLPWILEHGLYCPSSEIRDPNFVSIGKAGLIEERCRRGVAAPPGGTLADYVPFYFAPRTPMLGAIRFGYGVPQRPNEDLVFLVSSLHDLTQCQVRFLFTDRHAAARYARFSSSLADLAWLPWDDLRAARFRKDPDDPERFEQYQAEALAHGHVPLSAVLAIACYAKYVQAWLDREIAGCRLTVKTLVRSGWYIP